MSDFKIDALIEEAEKQLNGAATSNSIFKVRTATQCMDDASQLPVPQLLFDEFWVEGEVAILFADTGVGKSLLGVQVANSITRGNSIPGFQMTVTSKPKLGLFDFELSDKQFEKRYSEDYTNHYIFDRNFLRISIDLDKDFPDGNYEEIISYNIEQTIIEHQLQVVIVDNLTYMKGDTERAKDAGPLMKRLKTLAGKYQLSLLVLAHTPKRDARRPFTVNDLAGSKQLINFCDSAFCIGESFQDKNLRYLKQVKVRNAEHRYSTWNVALCELVKEENFTKFRFLETANEEVHLKPKKKANKDETLEDVVRMKKLGMSNRAIAKKHSIDEKTVRNWTSDDDFPF